MPSDRCLAICVLVGALLFASAACRAEIEPTEISTCDLIDSQSDFDGQLVAVKARVSTDLVHYARLVSRGCHRKPVALYFAEDSAFNPCGDSAFARTVECPLNGVDYLIVATFVGIYHSGKSALEVQEIKDMKRTRRKQHSDASFDEWVQRATLLEETPSARAYQDSMWPLVQPFVAALIERCISEDPKPDLTSFVWVATLTADGYFADMEVRPQTAVAACFSSGMEQAPFPKPPQEFAEEGMPVVLNMRLHRRG
jgi:hypothetical protein